MNPPQNLNNNLKSNDFLLIMEARRKGHNIFQALKDFCPVKIYFKNQDFTDQGKLRISHQPTYPKRTDKGRSINRNEIIKEGLLELQQGRKNMGNYNRLSFSS